MGNLRSVENAFRRLNVDVEVVQQIGDAERLLIPGVGAFGAAMERLAPLAENIRAFAKAGNPVLGICLGQQLLFDTSEELGEHRGLGIIPGRVRYLPKDKGLKVPHIGWTPLQKRTEGILADVPNGSHAYFVHSLYTDCEETADIAATADYGLPFPAAVNRGNVWGMQFHPEKSGDIGLSILKRFSEC